MRLSVTGRGCAFATRAPRWRAVSSGDEFWQRVAVAYSEQDTAQNPGTRMKLAFATAAQFDTPAAQP